LIQLCTQRIGLEAYMGRRPVKQSRTHRLCSTRSLTTVFLSFETVCSMYLWLWQLCRKICRAVSRLLCYNRKARAASAQSVTLW